MLCRACGMESRTVDYCEWCKRPLPPLPGVQPTQAMPAASPPPGRTVRVTLTGEVIESEEAPPYAAPGAYPPPNAAPPHPGMPYAANTPLGATIQANPMAVTPQMVQMQYRETEESLSEKREKALAIGLPIMILSMLLVHAIPAAFLWVGLADLFLLSMVMGATGAIPSYDEAFADCAIMLVVGFLFGPLIALILYWIVGLIKQEWNSAVLGLLQLDLSVFFFLLTASAGSIKALGGIVLMFGVLNFFGICVCFAGWMLSSFFRPLNE